MSGYVLKHGSFLFTVASFVKSCSHRTNWTELRYEQRQPSCFKCMQAIPEAHHRLAGTERSDLAACNFYRAMLCIRGTSHGPVSVCVCPSVTSRSSTKTAKRRITQTIPYDTPRDSSFLVPKISAKFDRGHPLRRRWMQVGWSKSATFDK